MIYITISQFFVFRCTLPHTPVFNNFFSYLFMNYRSFLKTTRLEFWYQSSVKCEKIGNEELRNINTCKIYARSIVTSDIRCQNISIENLKKLRKFWCDDVSKIILSIVVHLIIRNNHGKFWLEWMWFWKYILWKPVPIRVNSTSLGFFSI